MVESKGIAMNNINNIPELVTDVVDKLTILFINEFKLDKPTAMLIAHRAVRLITDDWGGQLIYIPKNMSGKLSERDINIWKDFNGKNHNELARRYDLTLQQIYKILREIGIREREKNQQDLFS